MSKPYDATGKVLFEADPVGWAAFLGAPRPPGRVAVIDSELSTVTAAADKVLRIADPEPWILDVEFQSWSDTQAPRQLLKYNGLLQDKYKVPVASVLVVLAEAANSRAYTGRLPVAPPLGPAWEFGYTVLRVWEVPAGPLLTGSLGLLPLAPVADVRMAEVPDLLRQVGDRLYREADSDTADRLLTAAALLLQLRYGMLTAQELMRTFPDLRESAIYQVMSEEGLAKGRAEGRRATVLRQGRVKFGDPTPEQEAAVDAVTDLDRLDALADRLLVVTTWGDLLRPG